MVEMEQFKGHPRLPKFVVPKRYDITLKPDLTACSFGGPVAVHLDIVCDTRFIVLNAADLSVDAASVSFASSKVLFKPWKVETFEEDGILVLEFGDTLPIGSGVLGIGFEGILNDKMKGFYRSTYDMSIMMRRKIWQLRSLQRLMPGGAFPAGMNLLGRLHSRLDWMMFHLN